MTEKAIKNISLLTDWYQYMLLKKTSLEIKTITGTLPLTVTAKGGNAVDWIIYGNSGGVGERTKNIADLSDIDAKYYGVRYYEENGFLRAVGKYNDTAAHTQPRFYYQLDAGSYAVSGSPDYEQTGVGLQIGTCTDAQGSNYISLGSDLGSGFSFTLENASWIVIRIYTAKALHDQDIDLTIPLMLRKADTTPEFIPYGYQVPLDIRHKTKNLVDLSDIPPKTAGNVTLTPDDTTGFVTCATTDGQLSSNNCTIPNVYLPTGISGNYYLSGCPNGGSETSTYDIYPWDETTNARPYQWDGVTPALSSTGDTPVEVQFIEGHTYRIGIRVRSGQNVDGLVFKPMLRLADTSPEFEPYYFTNHEDIFIGDAPLGEGESVSKSSTGIDIELFEGENTVSTTLTNKPEMTIRYK